MSETPSILTKASIESMLILTVLSLVLVQMISFGISAIFPQAAVFKVGVGFLMITLGVSIILPYQLLRQKSKSGVFQPISAKDVILIAGVFVLTWVIMTNVKIWIPEIFSIQEIDAFNQNALSIIGLAGR